MKPIMLFKSPGAYRLGRKTYAVCSVKTQEEMDERLANGWHQTRDEAIEAAGDAANVPEKKKPKVVLKKKQPKPINISAAVSSAGIKPHQDGIAVELSLVAKAMLFVSKLKRFFWS